VGKDVAILRVEAPAQMRYPTAGDWTSYGGHRVAQVTAADTGDDKMNVLLLLHELVECILCHFAVIWSDAVDAFDLQFEAERAAGKHTEDEEPGNDIRAPYWQQHQYATAVEVQMAAFLGVNWEAYEATLNDLPLKTL